LPHSLGTARSAVSATSASGWQRSIHCLSLGSMPCWPSARSCSSTRGHTAARSAGTSATRHALSQVPRMCGSRDGMGRQAGKELEFSHGSQGDPRGSSCCPQPVHSGARRDPGLTGWRSRAYRNQVELSMAAAACLRWAKITVCDCEAVHSGVNASYSWAHGDSQAMSRHQRIISGAPE
jgi:hypothetical protein